MDRSRWRWAVGSALLLTLSVTSGCRQDDPQSEGTSRPNRKVSRILSVELPPRAVLDPASSQPGREVYRINLPLEALAAYYLMMADSGTPPFDSVVSCRGGDGGESPLLEWEKAWRAREPRNFLVLRGTPDGVGDVLTIINEENSDRTCEAV